jgi:hypothetical protein
VFFNAFDALLGIPQYPTISFPMLPSLWNKSTLTSHYMHPFHAIFPSAPITLTATSTGPCYHYYCSHYPPPPDSSS